MKAISPHSLVLVFCVCLGACGSSEAQTDDDGSRGACEGLDPSTTCQTTGCNEGSVCEPVDGCLSSSCTCDPSSGTWECSDDCAQNYACIEQTVDCDDVLAPGTCQDEGAICQSGSECCCGECRPSFQCDCVDGSWSCYNTEACNIASCLGRNCDEAADCVFGDSELVCADGSCVEPEPEPCGYDDRERCDADRLCAWFEPAACGDVDPNVIEAGCYLEVQCQLGTCPDGFECTDVLVAPRCFWEEPLCDACEEQRTLCL